MKRSPVDTAFDASLARAGAALVAAALALAVFYHGPELPLLAGAEFLLVTWLALSLGARHTQGVRLPLTPVSVSLTLFWLWLAVSIAWSAVPVTSVINFWWVGSLALAFWAYTVAPRRERVWFYVARFALAGALALCAYALFQLFVRNEPPRATFIYIHSFAALMMLIALPLGGYFLLAWRARASRRRLFLLGACLFVLYFTIATTEGRGTTLSILLALSVFAPFAARALGRRSVVVLLALVIGAYAVANLVLHGGLGQRMETLADPSSAALPRLLIWRGSWAMLMRHPWWGIGLGTYYLAWPPFRNPVDNSLGFFVHNDYLQIWIEAGLPALLLLIGVFVSVFWQLVRLWRRVRATVALRVEALGLFAGLLAVAAHSFVDFNFYILPISITAGLVLGRFHECVSAAVPARRYTLRPARALSPPVYRTAVALLALFPLMYFVSLGLSDHLYKRGFALAMAGKLVPADNAFTWAERLLPDDDKVLTMHADLYRHVVARLPRTAPERRRLFEAGLALLDEAQSANPYRSLVHVVRGRMLQDNPDLTGPRWRAQAESEYAKAIALDPRFFRTRIEYAGLLAAVGRQHKAYHILNAGMRYWYYPSPAVLTYYGITADAAARLGDATRVTDIHRKMRVLRRAIASTVAARPVVPDLDLPVTASSS